MSERLRKNISNGGFDYEIRTNRIVVDTTAISRLFLCADVEEAEVGNKRVRNIKRCTSEGSISLTQQIDYGAKSVRYALKKNTDSYKGLLIENNLVVQSIGAGTANQECINGLLNEFISDFDKLST